jgi:type II secretory pathway component HofQ
MSTSLRLLPLALLLACASCRGPQATTLDMQVIPVQHVDAAQLANRLRADLGDGAFEGEPRIEVDRRNNALVVQATPADLARVTALVAEHDLRAP